MVEAKTKDDLVGVTNYDYGLNDKLEKGDREEGCQYNYGYEW